MTGQKALAQGSIFLLLAIVFFSLAQLLRDLMTAQVQTPLAELILSSLQEAFWIAGFFSAVVAAIYVLGEILKSYLDSNAF